MNLTAEEYAKLREEEAKANKRVKTAEEELYSVPENLRQVIHQNIEIKRET